MGLGYEDRMLRVVEYIHDNLQGDLSLDAVSDVAAMSRFHWHRVFHAMTGETLAQAVRRIRMHRAACWLVQTDDPIPEIGARCGYPNATSFARLFREHYGLTPAAFRSRGELRPPLLQPTKGNPPVFPVTIETTETRHLAGLPHTGPYLEIGKTFEKVSAIFSARNFWPRARGMAGVYYDDVSAVAPEALRSHAGVVVDGPAEDITGPDGPLEAVTLPSGRHAVLHYKGPYAGLKAAYDHLYGAWLPKSGEQPADAPPYEVYLNSPMDTAPEDLLTDICIPLR